MGETEDGDVMGSHRVEGELIGWLLICGAPFSSAPFSDSHEQTLEGIESGHNLRIRNQSKANVRINS